MRFGAGNPRAERKQTSLSDFILLLRALPDCDFGHFSAPVRFDRDIRYTVSEIYRKQYAGHDRQHLVRRSRDILRYCKHGKRVYHAYDYFKRYRQRLFFERDLPSLKDVRDDARDKHRRRDTGQRDRRPPARQREISLFRRRIASFYDRAVMIEHFVNEYEQSDVQYRGDNSENRVFLFALHNRIPPFATRRFREDLFHRLRFIIYMLSHLAEFFKRVILLPLYRMQTN